MQILWLPRKADEGKRNIRHFGGSGTSIDRFFFLALDQSSATAHERKALRMQSLREEVFTKGKPEHAWENPLEREAL